MCQLARTGVESGTSLTPDHGERSGACRRVGRTTVGGGEAEGGFADGGEGDVFEGGLADGGAGVAEVALEGGGGAEAGGAGDEQGLVGDADGGFRDGVLGGSEAPELGIALFRSGEPPFGGGVEKGAG